MNALRSATAYLLAACVCSFAVPGGAAQGPEAEHARAWAAQALLRADPASILRPGLHLVRQDHGSLRLRRSVLDTPLQLGATRYEHGIGTHSVSEISVRLPGPGKQFKAEAGVDNNHDTRGEKGSVVFVVEVAGKHVFRSPVRRSSDGPLHVGVELNGAVEFTLRVLDAGDGPGWDQADWAEASVMLANGKRIWLDEMALVTPGTGLSTAMPFSFVYGGRSSAELVPSWKRTHTERPAAGGREEHVVTWADPETGLEVSAEVTLFDGFPAVESMLRFRNTGKADTPILETVLPLALGISVPRKSEVVLHHAHGSTCTETDFLPIDQPVPPKSEITLAPNGGRSSNGRLPFFNLAWEGGGAVGAIGWSGQWEMRLTRNDGDGLWLGAGQQTTHLKLHPGESIRTPRVLLVLWEGGDRLHGHDLLRRVLLTHYVPRLEGKPVVPVVTQNTWFVFNTGNDVTEANQLEVIARMAPMGVEAYWLDAGWFEGGWPHGAGSWVPKSDAFPRGLRPLGDAAHEAGMKFVLWFEPERVNPASRIAKEHPEWVLRTNGGDGLFNLGDPAARAWLTDHLSKCIGDWGVDIYRNDFNIDPLPFWQKADAPDRRGMTEIRYVEGHYAMWDKLRKRHPGLSIDNCASGGRRIDLETISRSVPLWRSDTQCCGRAMPVWDQAQIAGLSLYVPLHSGGCWGFDPYTFRSIATTGANICPDTRPADFPVEQAKAAIAEARRLRPLYLGDYTPLLPINTDASHWCGWQFHRADMGQGFAMLFRRSASPYTSVDVALRGLEPEAVYEVTFARGYTPEAPRQMTGADLARLRATIDTAPGSLLVTYRRVDAATQGE